MHIIRYYLTRSSSTKDLNAEESLVLSPIQAAHNEGRRTFYKS